MGVTVFEPLDGKGQLPCLVTGETFVACSSKPCLLEEWSSCQLPAKTPCDCDLDAIAAADKTFLGMIPSVSTGEGDSVAVADSCVV